MKTNNKISALLLFSLGCLLVVPKNASAVFRVSAMGGGNMANPYVKGWQPDASSMNSVESSMKFGWTAGVTAELDLGLLLDFPIGVEVGAFYLQEKYGYKVKTTRILDSAVVTDVDLTTKINKFMFPLVLRYWIFDMVSPGLGFYLSKATGRIESTGATANGSPVNMDSDVPDALKTDYGFVGSLAAVIPLGIFDLRADARYYFGLDSNEQESGAQTKTRNLQLLLGAQFGL